MSHTSGQCCHLRYYYFHYYILYHIISYYCIVYYNCLLLLLLLYCYLLIVSFYSEVECDHKAKGQECLDKVFNTFIGLQTLMIYQNIHFISISISIQLLSNCFLFINAFVFIHNKRLMFKNIKLLYICLQFYVIINIVFVLKLRFVLMRV